MTLTSDNIARAVRDSGRAHAAFGCARIGGHVTIPFDADNFTNPPRHIDNQYWPLVPGTTLSYVGEGPTGAR
jgi:hypothetical protein